MRITIPCRDVQSYIENPKSFLPQKHICPNNPSHRPHWNSSWKRGFCPDHVNLIEIEIFNAYCEKCHETISYWPEFVLPYQREPLETRERVVTEHLEGISIRESAARIGYATSTLSRWIKLTFQQSLMLLNEVVSCILILACQTILPLTAEIDSEATMLLLAWLRYYAEWIDFPQTNRLMGLCNLLGKGNWDLWGAPLGNAKSRVKRKPLPG